MLNELFIHVCIVITFLFVGGSIFRFTPNLYSFKQKLIFGAATGILGSLLMFFTIHLTPETIMDYRHIAILIAALYGGPISTIAAVIIICFSRLVLIGGSLNSIIVSTFMMTGIGICSVLIAKTQMSKPKKWFFMYSLSLIILTAGFSYLLGVSSAFYELMIKYWSISILSGIILFYCVNFIVESNRTFYEMKKQSTTDFLTGLNNRRQFDATLSVLIEKAKKHNEKLSILMIDIDNFKNINDTYGHQAGDEVLRQMGELLSSNARSFDVPSRMGGDEFSILLLNCPTHQAMDISERIRSSVEKHNFQISKDLCLKFTVSIGIATYLETTSNPETIVPQADAALYKAKNAGKNKVCTNVAS